MDVAMYAGIDPSTSPRHPALIMAGSGETLSFGELDRRSSRLARLLASRGLRPGDHLAIFMENQPRYFDAVWAALRSGLYYTPINSRLTAPEVEYILGDCGARALVTSTALREVAGELVGRAPGVEIRLMAASGGPDGARGAERPPGFEGFEEAVAAHPARPLAREREGAGMFYSSGTTGRPKGILPPLPRSAPGEPLPLVEGMKSSWGFGPKTVYLSPAPLYHTAPVVTSTLVQRLGGTVVCLEHFDAEAALRAIERYRVSAAQFVPTMFVRMLKLPREARERYDLSSLEMALHAAAPCPVEVKRQMLDWWGPIVHEYYAGSENTGSTRIGPEEWLAHPGSVGRPQGCAIHILDDEGLELPVGEVGGVWFENPATDFVYHNDPAGTAASRNERGWATLGDVGYLDGEGYLYLTDRKAFTIISGGVNIYPREAEDVLVTHPKVMDAAVVGVPDPEMGEQVKAVVQPVDMALAGPALERELLDFCRGRLAHYKCPRSVDFEPELPRLENGKLYKRLIKDRYWGKKSSRIV